MNSLPLVSVGGSSSGGPASSALLKHRRSAAAVPVTNGTVVDGNPPDLASLFECPICYDYVLPPSMLIYVLLVFKSLKNALKETITFCEII